MKTSGPIKYRALKSGGYELLEDCWFHTGITGCAARVLGYVELAQDGLLTLRKGYRWDGASGPAVDRKANMRAGLAHDGLYQLMRSGHLGQGFRKAADKVFRQLYVIDGGWSFMGWLDYAGLRLGAGYAARQQPEVEVKALTAP